MVLRAWGRQNAMASREKKARSVTADSPTPSLGSAHSGSNSNISTLAAGNESAPTTPTSTRKGTAAGTGNANPASAVGGNASGSSGSSTSTTRGSLSRLKSKQQLLQQGADETGAVEDTGAVDSIVTTPSRTTRGGASREDSAGRDSPAVYASAKDKDDTIASSVNATKDVTKSPAIGARRAATSKTVAPAATSSTANARKNCVVALKRTALLKRKGKKIIGKPILGRKMVARRQLVAAAKSTGTRGASAAAASVVVVKKEAISPSSTSKEKEEELPSTPSLRNGKPRNSDSPVAKRKSAAVLKQDSNSKSLESLTGGGSAAIKMERRRSGSVSKCSDTTEDGDGTGPGADIKRELFDQESRSKMLDKMAEAFNERKAGGGASPVVGGGSKDDKGQASGGTLRRSMRQRKSTARDKEDFLTPRGKAGSSLDIKIEPAESFESLSVDGDGETVATVTSVAAPLTIDTTETEVSIGTEQLHSDGAASSLGGASSSGGSSSGGAAGAGGTGEEELVVGKDPSLSPGELVSEGVSEQSVKECYSEPAFLENNLGIEKDPKLGEIVQERFRCDKVSDDMEANADEAQQEKNATEGDVASDNGGGGADNAQEEQEVPTSATVKPVKVEDVEMEEERKESVEREDQMPIDQEGDILKDKGAESVSVEDKPEEKEKEDSDVVITDEIEQVNKNNSEEDKMDITEKEEEVVECAKEMENSDELVAKTAEETQKKEEDVTIILDEAEEVAETPVKDVLVDEAKSVENSPPTVDEDMDQTVTPEESLEAVEASDVNKATEKESVATCPSPTTPAATVSCKTNGESNGIPQSTPNQQTSRATAAGQQKPPVVNATTPKTTTTPGSSSSSSSSSSSTSKETKAKTRTTKEKTKEDEKTREEKLRQEKLRVEEKVREEKQRAERLEAEKRLKEELLQKSRLENGLEGEEGTKSGGNSPAASSSVADKETKTEPKTATTTTATALLSIGGLNLPAITIAITKKDSNSGSSSADEKEQKSSSSTTVVGNVPKSELEILPIKADGTTATLPAVVLLSKEEKPAKEGGAVAPTLADSAESRLRIISQSENAAAAVSVSEPKDSNKSLSIIKIENSNGSPVTVGSRSPTPATSNKKKESAEERKTALLDESDDAAKRKESHLKHLGLLTIQAASEEKQRRAEQKPTASMSTDPLSDGAGGSSGPAGTAGPGESWLSSGTNQTGGGRTGGNKSSRSSKDEYTVSMKSVTKGSGGGGARGEKRKQQRMPLKMTFQKGKGKGSGSVTTGRDSSNGSGTSSNGSGYATDSGNNNGDNTFYTAHINELDHHSSNSSDGHSHRESGAGVGRKAHSRSHTTDGVNLVEPGSENVSLKEVKGSDIVIPEKASSFNVHPERLCWDQCNYCGGKFGLYDTPCHVAALKSSERQQRILLATLPKITLDSCLCDACFRHVDRKANCPPQKKKTTSVSQTSTPTTASTGVVSNAVTNTSNTQSTVSPLVLKVTTNKDGSTSIATEQPATLDDGATAGGKAREVCAVRQCMAHAMQSLRRKWMVKMRRKIGKQLDINLEQAAKSTAEYISICNKHYEQISHLMICAMCTKPLQRNHVYHLYSNIVQLERLIQDQGISMRLNSSELVVCKLCKYYANLLIKPPEAKTRGAQFVKDYKKRLCNYRQRAAEEQQQQQQQKHPLEQLQQEIDAMRSLEQTAAPRQRAPIPVTDIVISDGDDDEEVAEEEEVEECPAPQQQPPVAAEARYQTFGNLFSIGDSSVSVRRRVSNRKSSDVSIVENNVASQMGELDEISIIPTTKSLTVLNQNQQQQQSSQDDNFDMTKVLKSNPNISMRELFPGEEELGIHVNIPFSSASVRTPEGWTKVTSTMQYDDSTRALWEELQKPYGNQSSFLRHLILLEKYFRNGDLVLSPQAKNNATTYSEAVQNRLRSYDNIPSSVPTSPPALASLTPVTANAAPDKTSSIFQQFSSATITIVPANKVRPKPGTTASSSSSSALSNVGAASDITPVSPPAPVSLLKSNNLHLANSSDQAAKNSLKRKLSHEGGRTSGGGNISFGSTSSSPLNTSGSNASKVVRLEEPKVSLSSPPELISINCKPSVTITTIPPGQTGPPPYSAALTATTQKQLSLLNHSSQQSLLQTTATPVLMAKKSPPAATNTPAAAATNTNTAGNATREIIQMPEQLTEAERRESSTRPWRPTLLPISPGVSESLKSGPLYQTADGRLLPKLVQVMSGGKPYHISIEDYNRMCILRREKLLQQQHNMIQTANKRQSQLPQPKPIQQQQQVVTPVIPPVPALRLASTSVENTLINNVPTTSGTSATAAKVVQFPNQLLEQNSLIPLYGGGGTSKIGNSAAPKSSSSSSLTVTMTQSLNSNSLASKTATVVPPAMKPLSLPNSTTVFPMMISANTISLPSLFTTSSASTLYTGVGGVTTQSTSASTINRRPSVTATSLVLAQPSTHLTTTNSNVPTTINPLDQLLKGGNLVTQAQLQEFVAAATAANGAAASQLDNSPDKLLSKIPKSLTVIPQQKQRSMSRVSSHEDQNSA